MRRMRSQGRQAQMIGVGVEFAASGALAATALLAPLFSLQAAAWAAYNPVANPPVAISPISDQKDQTDAAISGMRVIWRDTRYGSFDLFLSDLRAHQEQRITS